MHTVVTMAMRVARYYALLRHFSLPPFIDAYVAAIRFERFRR